MCGGFGVVDVVVATTDENGATDEVAEGDGEEIHEKEVVDGDRGAEKHAGGDVEHVGDRVLEAAEDEEHDGEEDGEDFAGGGFSGEAHPDGDADEEITEDATKKGGGEAEVDFGFGGGGEVIGDGVEGAGGDGDEGDKEGA